MSTRSLRRLRSPVRRLLAVALLLVFAPLAPTRADAQANAARVERTLAVIDGTDASGAATERWLTLLRKRLPPARLETIAAT